MTVAQLIAELQKADPSKEVMFDFTTDLGSPEVLKIDGVEFDGEFGRSGQTLVANPKLVLLVSDRQQTIDGMTGKPF